MCTVRPLPGLPRRLGVDLCMGGSADGGGDGGQGAALVVPGHGPGPHGEASFKSACGGSGDPSSRCQRSRPRLLAPGTFVLVGLSGEVRRRVASYARIQSGGHAPTAGSGCLRDESDRVGLANIPVSRYYTCTSFVPHFLSVVCDSGAVFFFLNPTVDIGAFMVNCGIQYVAPLRYSGRTRACGQPAASQDGGNKK